jgi:hypothetical protein
VAETIQVLNHGDTKLDFHFYQYSDFDLGAGFQDDVVIDPSRLFVDQTPTGNHGSMLNETVLTPKPNRAEANTYAVTLGKLNDGAATNLSNNLSVAGTDGTWAFQWDKVLAAGNGTLVISKDKNLAPVPEPMSLALLGGVLVIVARKLRKTMA